LKKESNRLYSKQRRLENERVSLDIEAGRTVELSRKVGTKNIDVVQYREKERMGRRGRKGWTAEKDRMDYRQKRLDI
jgi:hypothetical protein